MKVLILCTGNSARSQMAEGILRALSKGEIEVASAGTHPSCVHPLAVEALREIGIDISQHRSKSVDEFSGQRFDVVITVCDRAQESCPVFPGAPKRIHWSYDDPAAVEGAPEEKLAAFRRVRDDLAVRLSSFLDAVGSADSFPGPSVPRGL
ncbi:MAG: arsenate reductase ArsC [Acidobacteriia bacterium]|nr:arsenate reductase ArsC [Terriglobia bacterium]